MLGMVPLGHGRLFDVRHVGVDVARKGGLGADEVDEAQGGVGGQQLLDVGAYEVGHSGEDAHDLALYLGLGLAYAVVGLDYLFGLDKHGLATGTLVVHDAVHLALVHGRYRQYQASVAHRGGRVAVEHPVLAASGNDAAHDAVDAGRGSVQGRAQLGQLGRGIVLDVAKLVEHALGLGTYLWKGLHAGRELCQGRVAHAALVVGPEKGDDACYGGQRALQVVEMLGGDPCAGCSDAPERGAQVKEIVERKLALRLNDAHKLVDLCEPGLHLVVARRELHLLAPGHTHGADAALGYLVAHHVKSYFVFKIAWIYHA